MVKKDIPKNITLNLGKDMVGGGKKRRGRPRKTAPKEVIVKEVLPHQKFSRKANKALDQLLEANREKEKAEAEKALIQLVKMRGAGLEEDIAELKALKEKRKAEYFDLAIYDESKNSSLKELNKKIEKLEEQVEAQSPPKELSSLRLTIQPYEKLIMAQRRIKAGLDKSGKKKDDIPQDGRGLIGAGDKPPIDYNARMAEYRREREERARQEDEEARQELKDIPQFGSTTLKLPPFFAVPTKKGWRLANPLTEMRNLANRQHDLSINIKRSNVKKPELDFSIPRRLPRIEEFSGKDQEKLRAYMKAVEEGKEQEYLFKNKPRGFPAVLYKNAKKAGYKETKEKVYRKNTLKPKKVSSIVKPQKQQRKVEEPTYQEESQLFPKKKINTAEEYLERFNLEKFYEELVKVWKRYVPPGNHKEAIEYTKKQADRITNGLSEVELPTAELEKVKKLAHRIEAQMGFFPTKFLPEKYANELKVFFKEREEAKKKGGAKKKLVIVEDEPAPPPKDKIDEMIEAIEQDAPQDQKRYDLLKNTYKYIKENEEKTPNINKLKRAYDKGLRKLTASEFYKKRKESKGRGLSGFKEHSVMKDDSDNEDQEGGCDGEGYGGSLNNKVIKHFKKDEKEMKKLSKAFKHHKEVEESVGGSLSAKDLKDLLGASYDPKKDKVNDFELDKEISSPTSKVYFNKKTGQAVVAHMGTQGLIDWSNNAVYAVGGEWAYKRTKRYKEAKSVQQKAESKYGAKNVSTIGHSQGGLQSELLGKKSKEVITLNKATRPFGSKKSEKQTDIRTTGDIVSSLNPFQSKNNKEIVIKSKTYNPIKEHSIETLDELKDEKKIGEGLAEIFSQHNNIMPSQGGRMLGLTKHAVLPAHTGHPALMSDQYPRIPQSFTQVHLAHPRPIGCGLGAGMDSDSDSDMEGCGMRGGRTYAQRLRARARRAFAPVERFAKKTFTPKLGRDISKTLIHDALPAVVSGVVGTTATALTGSPMVGALAGQTLGKVAGKKAGDAVGKVAGMGMKRPKLVKGSKEAKEYMASIRSKRMKGGELPPRSRGIVTDPSLL